MGVKRTFTCDIEGCENHVVEELPGLGTGRNSGWIQIIGVNFNGADNPFICFGHAEMLMDHLDTLEGKPVINFKSEKSDIEDSDVIEE